MLSLAIRQTIKELLEENEAKIADCQAEGFSEVSRVADLVEHLKRQNNFFRRLLG